MRVQEESKEQEALEQEGVGGAEVKRKKSSMGFWTRRRTVALIAFLVVLVLLVSIVMALL